METKPLVHRD